MAAGGPSAADTSDAPATFSSATPYPDRLREALDVLSQECESGVSDALEAASLTVSEIVDAAAAMSAEADDGRGRRRWRRRGGGGQGLRGDAPRGARVPLSSVFEPDGN